MLADSQMCSHAPSPRTPPPPTTRYYRQAFADLYETFFEEAPPEPLGLALLWSIYFVMACCLSFGFHVALDLWLLDGEVLAFSSRARQAQTPRDDVTRLLLAVLLLAKALVLVVWSMRKTCLVGFLQGRIKASTVTLWRRDRFTAVNHEKDIHTQATGMGTTLYQEQRGDWLNLVRPRGYLTAHLEFHGMPLYVVNTHLNLGEKAFRRRQVEELTQHCERLGTQGSVLLCGDFNVTPESEEIQRLCAQAGVTDALHEQGCVEPTWTSSNPLTHGVLLEEDHRCDFIFYRGLVQRHRLVNRRCRLDVPLWGKTWLSDHLGIVLDLVMEPLV